MIDTALERDPWWTWPSRVAGVLLLCGSALLPLAVMWKRSFDAQPKQESVGQRGLRPKMILLPKGRFRMGGDEYPNEQPVHEVRVTQAFALSETEVTQAQYKAVMEKNPSEFQARPGWENLPVENVSWFDAVAYCNKLSDLEGLPRCYRIEGEVVKWESHACPGYRLPTEAEWEYAARADEPARYAGSDRLDEVAWYNQNSGDSTHAVASKKPNAWYLYDLSGNVWEWVWDWYQKEYYSQSPREDPAGPSNGGVRVLRGGSWDSTPGLARVANRYWGAPGSRARNVGFRLARSFP